MINITYAEVDAHTAEEIQRDLASAQLRLDHPALVVLVTPDSIEDSDIHHTIDKARAENQLIIPVLLRPTEITGALVDTRVLDLTKGYKRDRLITFIRQADMSREQQGNNSRLLYWVGGASLIMFIISILSIGSGIVAFPVDEYATENAIREDQINTVVAPQLEAVRPRTTEDALNFDATLEAIGNDDLIPFLVGTATAIPEQIQATNAARSTQAFATDAAATESAGEE